MYLAIVAAVVLAGGILATFVAGAALGAFLERFELPPEDESERGLDGGGFWIGITERSLIYIFVMLGEPSGVGFLVAAKSIFRVGELRDGKRKLAEYILIGTLASFTLAVLAAVATQLVLRLIGA